MIIYSNHDFKNEIILTNYSLFLDDIRVPTDVKFAWHQEAWEEFPSLFSWIIVRTYNQFTDCIRRYQLPKRISFDHDLSWEHYPQGELVEKPIEYSKYKEKTGLHCAQWLVEYCLEKGLGLPDFYVHSFNPVGRKNIIDYLNQFDRMKAVYDTAKDSDDDSGSSKIIIP